MNDGEIRYEWDCTADKLCEGSRMKQSRTREGRAGIGCLAKVRFRRCTMMAKYSGRLMYAYLCCNID